MALTFRDVKLQTLTSAEGDANIRHLRDKPDGQVYPKTQGVGVKIDTASPDYGWHDLLSAMVLAHNAEDPVFEVYIGAVRQLQFDVGKAISINFHLPHDYAMGTDIFIHAHWSHNSATVTSGDISGFFEASYSKGHGQAAFSAPVAITLANVPASPIRYQHMITETQLSATGGVGGLLVTEDLEVDGLLLCRLELTGNTMDGGALPFVHAIDIHYQSTGLPTKQRAPDFWT